MGSVPEPSGFTFAALLRQLRTGAGLTQEELAAAAQLSPRSISDLERGINLTARRDTARLLADALQLTGAARTGFEAAARGQVPPGSARPADASASGVAVATRTLPRDTGAFTDREPELQQLRAAAARAAGTGGVVQVYAIGGMAGVGKTAFAVHAAHILAAEFPDGQIFLPLHAHTPGQPPVDPADALASLLLTAGVAAGQIPPGLEARSRLWRDHVAGRRMLLAFDDTAGHEQIRPLLPGTAGSLVLVTSRRHLTALEDAQTISLDILPAGEAAELLIRLAGRTGLSSADPAVREIARLSGYLPLPIGMLARQLHHHPAWTAAELAADLAAARDRLDFMQAENLSVAAAFNLSYQDLTPGQQQMFRRLGLHPGTEVDAYAAAALDGSDLPAARRTLSSLYDHYLIAEPARGRYRLHDLMREHARALAAGDPAADNNAAADRLLGYYLDTARVADRQLARRTPTILPAAIDREAAHVPDLSTREDSVAWMGAERRTLHATISYAAGHDRLAQAVALSAAMHGYLRFKGHWDQALALHNLALDCARQAEDRSGQAGALTDLGDIHYAMRNYALAGESLTQALQLYRELGNRLGEAHALTELSTVRHLTGDNLAAAGGLNDAVRLYRKLGDRRGEANALSRLGNVQLATGEYRAGAAGLALALRLYRDLGDRLGEAHAVNDLGALQQAIGSYPAAVADHTRALRLYRELGDRRGEANALSDLGAAYQAIGEHAAAAEKLAQALELYRVQGDRLGEAVALGHLGAEQLATADYRSAVASQKEALALYRAVGNLAGEAESLINLGDARLAAGEPDQARDQYQQARTIVIGIASPLADARALEGIGRCHLLQGQLADGTAALRQALAIYRRIGSPGADRIQQLLSVQEPGRISAP
jgi:tetratricopeptide (TPR) repeat protein/transcriptional regulator with XRE-family HTH domain